MLSWLVKENFAACVADVVLFLLSFILLNISV